MNESLSWAYPSSLRIYSLSSYDYRRIGQLLVRLAQIIVVSCLMQTASQEGIGKEEFPRVLSSWQGVLLLQQEHQLRVNQIDS